MSLSIAPRLPIDASIAGYWGFDESLETDPAVDESLNALNLTVSNSSSVPFGRVGFARGFDGTSTFAAPASSSSLRLVSELTVIIWARITVYNSTGSSLRTLVSCGGPTTGDGLLYSLSVDGSGRLVYKHTSASGEVVVRTATSTIKTNQLYSIALRRTASGGGQLVEFFVDNVQKTVADISVAGSPVSFPVPVPAANASATFSVGRSQRETDSAFWLGAIDELSIHTVARPFQPYLKEAYFRIALANDLSRVTYFNNILTVSSYEMGGGVRWWCFERDKDLFVVKESPFGNFLSETRLTTVGGGSASLTTKPELIYDPASDTLLVLFSAGNRIFKLTAQSTDDPATINMPFTADTGGVIKNVDNVEGGRVGTSGGQGGLLDLTYVNRQPIKLYFSEEGGFGTGGGDGSAMGRSVVISAAFMDLPTLGFGMFIGSSSMEGIGGFRAFRRDGGGNTPLPTPVLVPGTSTYFSPISARTYGAMYFAEALGPFGIPTGQVSNTLVDRFNEPLEKSVGGTIDIGRDSDGSDYGSFGVGSGGEALYTLFYVNRSPVKFSFEETGSSFGCGGGQNMIISSTGRGTVYL